jgi:hypothetical protein
MTETCLIILKKLPPRTSSSLTSLCNSLEALQTYETSDDDNSPRIELNLNLPFNQLVEQLHFFEQYIPQSEKVSEIRCHRNKKLIKKSYIFLLNRYKNL